MDVENRKLGKCQEPQTRQAAQKVQIVGQMAVGILSLSKVHVQATPFESIKNLSSSYKNTLSSIFRHPSVKPWCPALAGPGNAKESQVQRWIFVKQAP